MRLHEWLFPLAVFHANGEGEVNASTPVMLGDGVRLFDHLGGALPEVEQVRAVEAPGVTHLRYRVP